MSLAEDSAARLRDLEREDLLRRPPTLHTKLGRSVCIDGQTFLCFSSNDYLGLASPALDAETLLQSSAEASLGSGGSRLISGTQRAHRDFELKLAAFLDEEDGILFSTGYAANLGLLQGLAEAGDLIVSDQLNHASIIDGCRLSRARAAIFPHLDLGHLEALLEERKSAKTLDPSLGRTFIVIESVFSMDGDEAPLKEIQRLARRNGAYLIVDEAHSFGLYGEQGRGLSAELGVRPDLRILAFGKSLGGSGAMVVGDSATVNLLRHRARSYVFSTAPSPLLLALLDSNLDRLIAAEDARRRLFRMSAKLRERLRALGFRVLGERSPILPVIIGENRRALELDRALRERGFLVQAIRPPTVPAGSARLRIVVSAAHRIEDIDALADAFEELKEFAS
ncbi:MAG: 8-amino-7-oxononanoate synthase [Sandaracinaceae bacterium]|nr:8-amino-7-oxononanoate synthase [Sandaracinaceae bacterium]